MTTITKGVKARCEEYCCFSNGDVVRSIKNHDLIKINETLTYYSHSCSHFNCYIAFEGAKEVVNHTHGDCRAELYGLLNSNHKGTQIPKDQLLNTKEEKKDYSSQVKATPTISKPQKGNDSFQTAGKKKKKTEYITKCRWGIHCKIPGHNVHDEEHICNGGEACDFASFPDLCRRHYIDGDVPMRCGHYPLLCLNEFCKKLHFCHKDEFCDKRDCVFVHSDPEKNIPIHILFKKQMENNNETEESLLEKFYIKNKDSCIRQVRREENILLQYKDDFHPGIDCPKEYLSLSHDSKLCRFCMSNN